MQEITKGKNYMKIDSSFAENITGFLIVLSIWKYTGWKSSLYFLYTMKSEQYNTIMN